MLLQLEHMQERQLKLKSQHILLCNFKPPKQKKGNFFQTQLTDGRNQLTVFPDLIFYTLSDTELLSHKSSSSPNIHHSSRLPDS